MTSFERCYTPSPKAVEVEHAFALKEWMSPFLTMLHNISNPHAFKFTKAPSGKVVIQYKNWESDKQENWKPFSPDPEEIPVLLSCCALILHFVTGITQGILIIKNNGM